MRILSCFLIVLSLTLCASSCNKETATSKSNSTTTSDMEKTSDQGKVEGTVVWLEGNFMPSPGTPARKGKPIVREIVFCKPLKMNETKKEGTFFVGLEDQVVKSVTSDDKGKFSIELPAGTYSVLSKEENGYYANLFDGQGLIQAVKVQAGQTTPLTVKVDYKATF